MSNLDGKRLFVDMDGTLAKWEDVPYFERLLEEGYFRERPPMQNVIDAVKNVYNQHPDVEVYILSSCLKESQYAEAEKNAWLDEHLPEIDAEHRLFPAFGEDKGTAIPEGIKENDFLLDDYSQNLFLFDPPATGIKLLNGINHTRESWEKNALSYNKEPQELADDIFAIMDSKAQIRDKKPQDIERDTQAQSQQAITKEGLDVSKYTSLEFDTDEGLEKTNELQVSQEEHTDYREMEDTQDVSIFDNRQKDDMAKEIFQKDVQPLKTRSQPQKDPLLMQHKMKGLEL